MLFRVVSCRILRHSAPLCTCGCGSLIRSTIILNGNRWTKQGKSIIWDIFFMIFDRMFLLNDYRVPNNCFDASGPVRCVPVRFDLDRPSVPPSVRPSFLPSVRLSFRPSVHPFVHPSVSPFVHPCVRPPARMLMFFLGASGARQYHVRIRWISRTFSVDENNCRQYVWPFRGRIGNFYTVQTELKRYNHIMCTSVRPYGNEMYDYVLRTNGWT